MNKLMRFNPQPFDLETTFGLNNEHELLEQEEEVRGSGARSRYGRPTPVAGGRVARPRLARARKPVEAGGTDGSPPHAGSPASWPKGRRRRYSSIGVPAWDYADLPAGRLPAAPASDHVAWIQARLNEALGLRLAVNGVLNAATRSAIRLFQERNGLQVNGRVGPETEAALRDGAGGAQANAAAPADPQQAEPAAAGEPASDSSADENAGELSSELDVFHVPSRMAGGKTTGSSKHKPHPGIKALRENIVRIALREAGRWKDGGLRETDPKTRAVLQDYWKTGASLSFSQAELGSATFQSSHPWSAAFISWVMRKAGAGAAFKYSPSHSTYISAAKANRIAGNSNVFKAYRLNEVAPRVGDLICRSRAGSKATYDTIRPGMTTHCDIVVAVAPGALKVVGGNVSDSVKSRVVKIDNLGRVIHPLAFAVIRVGTRTPPVPGAISPPAPQPAPGPLPSPSPTPMPANSEAPKLLKQDSVPPASTLYAEIDLGIVDSFKIRAAPMTGIFFPKGFKPGPSVDIILYLHGHKAEAIRKLAIDEYWNASRFPYGALREKLNEAARRAILVAPTLGTRSEAGTLLKPGGLDGYLTKVLASIGAAGPGGQGRSPALRHLVVACHSGGGMPMRLLAGGTDKTLAKLRECWGFDCTYNSGDDTFWAGWAAKNPDAKCYFHYIEGSQTAKLSESLRDKRISNAIVLPALDKRHNYVPITHWQERIQSALFLGTAAGGDTPPPTRPGEPSDEPADLKSLSHEAFIEFVGSRARTAMAQTGVPASVTVAQAIIETGWGRHVIGAAKNLFGIKGKGPAGSVRTSTREFVNGKWTTIKADFAKYDSFAESIAEHARFFLKHKRYGAALKAKDDADSFARAIAKAGYATAPDYAEQLIKAMKTHDLYRFDRTPHISQPVNQKVRVAGERSKWQGSSLSI